MDIFTIADRDGVTLCLRLNEWSDIDPSRPGGYMIEIETPSEDEPPLLYFRADDLARIGIAFLKGAAYLEMREDQKKRKKKY